MGYGRVRHLDDFQRKYAVTARGVGVQLGGGKLKILAADHEGLVGLVSAHHLGSIFLPHVEHIIRKWTYAPPQ